MEESEDSDSEIELGLQDASRPHLPTLDLGRLVERCDELALQQKKDLKQQQQRQLHRSQATPSPDPNKRLSKPHKLRLAQLAHLDGCTKAKVSRAVQTSHVKTWLHSHGYVVKADKLHPAIARVIAEWFQLVDDDNSRTLEHRELLTALKAAHIPCDDATITEMIQLMDMNRDGVIDWDEFEVFMTEELAAGKSLLSGEYVLPSGQSINFGVMIGKLKRNKLLSEIMEDPRKRSKWAAIADNPEALGKELATMQHAAEAAGLNLEHVKRAGPTTAVVGTPRAHVMTALLRGMDDRRVAQAVAPVRAHAEVAHAGAVGFEPPQRAAPQSVCSVSGSTTTPQRPCPDPTAAPLAPHRGDGGLDSCSSMDPLMPTTSGVEVPTANGSGSGGSFSPSLNRSVTTSFGSAAGSVGAALRPSSPGASTRRAASTQSTQYGFRPASSLGLTARTPEPRQPGQSSAPVPRQRRAGADASPPMPHPAACWDPTVVPTYGGRRASEAAFATNAFACTCLSPALPSESPGGGYAGVSASRLYGPKGGFGRHSNPSPVPLRPAPSPTEPHHVVATTASSEGHCRPPSRTMSHVSLMAKEMRGPSGRIGGEPQGAGYQTRQAPWSWSRSGSSGSGSGMRTARLAQSTADGYLAGSPPSSPGGRTTAASLAAQLHGRGGTPSSVAALFANIPSYMQNVKALPVPPNPSHSDSTGGASAAGKAHVGGGPGGGAGYSAGSSRSMEAVGSVAAYAPGPLQPVPPGSTIAPSDSPSSPRPPTTVPVDMASGDGFGVRGSRHAGQPLIPAAAPPAAQPAGLHGSAPTGAAGGGVAAKPLRPTSSLARARTDAPLLVQGNAGGAAPGARLPVPPAAGAVPRENGIAPAWRYSTGDGDGGESSAASASNCAGWPSPSMSMYSASRDSNGDLIAAATASVADSGGNDSRRTSGMSGYALEGRGLGSSSGCASRSVSRLVSGAPQRTGTVVSGQEPRPPSRPRTPMANRSEREDLGTAGWRASAASLLQMHIAKQLHDLEV